MSRIVFINFINNRTDVPKVYKDNSVEIITALFKTKCINIFCGQTAECLTLSERIHLVNAVI